MCLCWIAASADMCGADYEVIVADAGSDTPPDLSACARARLVEAPRTKLFNKPVALNAGMDAAAGDIVTFLDADAIVGPEFMRGPDLGGEVCRWCYRVWYTDVPPGDAEAWKLLFARTDKLTRGYEARCTPESGWHSNSSHAVPLFGNSQASMRAADLKGLGLRHNEAYAGRGFEDLEFMRHVWFAFGASYRAGMHAEPERNLVMLRHRYEADWSAPSAASANFRRYRECQHHQ
jgi:glycosyltransferase involved in cell wall biosynthesis